MRHGQAIGSHAIRLENQHTIGSHCRVVAIEEAAFDNQVLVERKTCFGLAFGGQGIDNGVIVYAIGFKIDRTV